MRHLTKRLILVSTLILAVPFLVACDSGDGGDGARKESVNNRTESFDRARAAFPDPTNLQNFPMREALVDFTYRQDMVNHPWYIYVMSPMTGEPIGYFVGRTYPQSNCNFLSDNKKWIDLSSGNDAYGETTAPSYDGVYYGDADCTAVFFFDATTNAMHTLEGLAWFASDQPLNLDVQRLGTEGYTDPVAPSTPIPAG
jgi:hypothetical protein